MQSIRLFLFIGLVAVAFTSCKKDPKDFEGLRVTINGSEWTAPTTTGAALGDQISINAADPSALKALILVVPNNIVAGTYNIEPFGDIQCTYSDGGATSFLADSGKVVITEHNTGGKRIKGTFEFQGTNVFNSTTGSFTKGEFNLVYQ